MTDETVKKLTDEEIEKALECCSVAVVRNCKDCPLFRSGTDCVSGVLEKQALEYINRLKAKNAELIKEREARLESAYEHNVAECKKCMDIVEMKHQIAQEGVKEQIRKETAKEIFDYINQSGAINVAPDTIKMYFKYNFGVEVEK